MSSEALTPEVLWAQRSNAVDAAKNFVYVTINVPDVPPEDIKLDVQSSTISFTGTSSSLKKKYHIDLALYGEIDPTASAIHHTGKNVEMKLQKKELTEEYWPRLLKENKKMHFLKTDFDKWVDEDEQDVAPEEDLSQFGAGGGMGGMPGMGGMGGGMPGMGGMGGMGGPGGGDFGGIDFSKLGSGDMSSMMANMGGAGGGPEEEDEDDDDEMPALEGEDDSAAKAPATEAAKESATEAAKEPVPEAAKEPATEAAKEPATEAAKEPAKEEAKA